MNNMSPTTSAGASSFRGPLDDKVMDTLRNPSADWQSHLNSLQQLVSISLPLAHQGLPTNHPDLKALLHQLRLLSPSLALLIGDLRSSLVRAVCDALISLSDALGAPFVAQVHLLALPALLKRASTTKAVIRHSANLAAAALLQNGLSTISPKIPHLLANTLANKRSASAIRVAAAHFVRMFFTHPQVLPHHNVRPVLDNAILAGVQDADPQVRDESRNAWLSLAAISPHAANNLLLRMPPHIAPLLDDLFEDDYGQSIKDMILLSSSSSPSPQQQHQQQQQHDPHLLQPKQLRRPVLHSDDPASRPRQHRPPRHSEMPPPQQQQQQQQLPSFQPPPQSSSRRLQHHRVSVRPPVRAPLHTSAPAKNPAHVVPPPALRRAFPTPRDHRPPLPDVQLHHPPPASAHPVASSREPRSMHTTAVQQQQHHVVPVSKVATSNPSASSHLVETTSVMITSSSSSSTSTTPSTTNLPSNNHPPKSLLPSPMSNSSADSSSARPASRQDSPPVDFLTLSSASHLAMSLSPNTPPPPLSPDRLPEAKGRLSYILGTNITPARPLHTKWPPSSSSIPHSHELSATSTDSTGLTLKRLSNDSIPARLSGNDVGLSVALDDPAFPPDNNDHSDSLVDNKRRIAAPDLDTDSENTPRINVKLTSPIRHNTSPRDSARVPGVRILAKESALPILLSPIDPVDVDATTQVDETSVPLVEPTEPHTDDPVSSQQKSPLSATAIPPRKSTPPAHARAVAVGRKPGTTTAGVPSKASVKKVAPPLKSAESKSTTAKAERRIVVPKLVSPSTSKTPGTAAPASNTTKPPRPRRVTTYVPRTASVPPEQHGGPVVRRPPRRSVMPSTGSRDGTAVPSAPTSRPVVGKVSVSRAGVLGVPKTTTTSGTTTVRGRLTGVAQLAAGRSGGVQMIRTSRPASMKSLQPVSTGGPKPDTLAARRSVVGVVRKRSTTVSGVRGNQKSVVSITRKPPVGVPGRAVGTGTSTAPREKGKLVSSAVGARPTSLTAASSAKAKSDDSTNNGNADKSKERDNTERLRLSMSRLRAIVGRGRGDWNTRVDRVKDVKDKLQVLDRDELTPSLIEEYAMLVGDITNDGHHRVLVAGLDALFVLMLRIESHSGSISLQRTLERRSDVLKRVLHLCRDNREDVRLAGHRVLQGFDVQFAPEVQVGLILRAMGMEVGKKEGRSGSRTAASGRTEVPMAIGDARNVDVGCKAIVRAFEKAERVGEGFEWSTNMLEAVVVGMGKLSKDKRVELRRGADNVMNAMKKCLPDEIFDLVCRKYGIQFAAVDDKK